MSLDPDWWGSAACLSVTPDLFFADVQGASAQPALLVCRGCPVKVECLDYGFAEVDGVWGGTTPKQRKRMRRTRRAA